MIKQELHTITGMQRDLAVNQFSPNFAYEAYNIRITPMKDNTALSVTNEKGNKKITIKNPSGKEIFLEGYVIGYYVLNSYLVLFTSGPNISNIYRLKRKGDYFEGILLYKGDSTKGYLNFNVDNPIETLGIYENEDIQKVYWIDGINQPRVINIVAPSEVRESWNSTSFDFVPTLSLREEVTVTKNYTGGSFASGVIQYAFTYYNLYGQESNIFYTTPLYYISSKERGNSPEESVGCSFTISITNIDDKFDFLRIYSIHRTSIDATPTVTNIADLAIKNASSIMYVDTGTTGATIEPSELLYKGRESIVPQTMTQKDNTLFFGNLTLKFQEVNEDLRNMLSTLDIQFKTNSVYIPFPKGYYDYSPEMVSSELTTFHSRDWYRFGVQFQDTTGRWSEVIYIKDAQVNRVPQITKHYMGDYRTLVKCNASVTLGKDIINNAIAQGYVKVRGVIVYPSINDREVLAQGILCPTVYNLNDRFSNSPFVQSSWFVRPYLGVDVSNNEGFIGWDGISGEIIAENDEGEGTVDPKGDYDQDAVHYRGRDLVNFGAWAEFRHNYPIPNNYRRNAEIQCITNAPSNPLVTTAAKGVSLDSWVQNRQEYFFIDQSIVTLHSPDIEFDDQLSNIDNSSLKLRIIGKVFFTSNIGDIDIQTSTPPNNSGTLGFYKETIGSENISALGSRSLISGSFYMDAGVNPNLDLPADPTDIYLNYMIPFYIYPWHRNGSLNNSPVATDGSQRSAMLKQKKISNLKYAAYTQYFDINDAWHAYVKDDPNHTGISGVAIFNSDEQSLIRLPAPSNSTLSDINYYGNIDKVVTPSRTNSTYWLPGIETDKMYGYPIIVGGLQIYEQNTVHDKFVFGPNPLLGYKINTAGDNPLPPYKSNFGTDPVSIKYKSTPHAVMVLNYTTDKRQLVLPSFYTEIPDYSEGFIRTNDAMAAYTDDTGHPFWDENCVGVYQDMIGDSIYSGNDYAGLGFLWLGELYRDNVENRFGGSTPEALEDNTWFPAGEPVSLYNYSGDIPVAKTEVEVPYTQGDTYFQRYDCLKTYPYTLEDSNSIAEIASFYCESRVNIDGRYDRNRGQTNNLVMSPTNFNLINPVYSQQNNFFTYRTLNYNRYSLDYFPNTIVWSKEKSVGETIDGWCNITMSSTLNLDGDKGEITSLNTYNNEIYCFQETGLSNIIFNPRVQVPVSNGAPIEITNSLKVEGKRYISNNIGCANKWSIVETPKGIYFVDNRANSIYLLNSTIESLSDKLGFKQWMNNRPYITEWKPVTYNNFISFYDIGNNDVYFVTSDNALNYSEYLNQFTSFMSYGKVLAMFNLDNKLYSIKGTTIWEHFAGDYNSFYGEYKPFSVTIVSNDSPTVDKIFNTIEYRADNWNVDSNNKQILQSEDTFDTLEVWNEYQKGVCNLKTEEVTPSALKKKFRIWRANIPRANTDWNGVKANKMDRIRNTWAYVKLSMNKENTDRMELHDIVVRYFV